MLAPSPIRPPGTFGIPDPDSATKGISTQRQRYINNNPTKATMVFSLGEKTKLAHLRRLRRCIQATLQGTKTLLNNLDPNNVAVNGHVEIEDKLHLKQCKTSSVGQSAGLLILRSSVRFRQKPKKTENSNRHGFEVHRPSSKGTKLLLQVIKAIVNHQKGLRDLKAGANHYVLL